MTSAVTNNLRKELLDQFKSNVEGVDNYYVGFSRSDDFTPETDISSNSEQSKLRNSLQSVKILSNASFVVPTVTWTSGNIYEAYDDNNSAQTNFYVVNSVDEVYICIEQGKDAFNAVANSIVEPSGALNGNTFKTSDGYKWRLMYKMSAAAISNFKTASYMPVSKIQDSASSLSVPEEITQRLIQDNAVSGEILSVAIDDASGTGYLASSTISITGDGTGSSFSMSVDDDGVNRVQVDSDGSGSFSHGSGYSHAATIATDGTGVTLRPVISPAGGLAADPVVSLKSRSLMLQVDIQGDEGSTLVSENDFRQVVLLKNPKQYNSNTLFSGNTGNCLKYFETSVATGDFLEDELVSTSSNSARLKVFYHDRPASRLYYYQDQETGFDSISNNAVIQNITGTTRSLTVLSLGDPDIDVYSGEILYLNNISSSITREETQTEDIRIVIELG